jgi:hypothetical protein
MTYSIAAKLRGENLNPVPIIDAKADSISKQLDQISKFLEPFTESQDEILTKGTRDRFRQIADSLATVEAKFSKINKDCHSPSLKKFAKLNARVQDLTEIYRIYDVGREKQKELSAEIKRIKECFKLGKELKVGPEAIKEKFNTVWELIITAKKGEFTRFPLFSNKFASKEAWAQQIREHTLLFCEPDSPHRQARLSPLFVFCSALINQQVNQTHEAYNTLPQDIQQKFHIEGSGESLDGMLRFLKNDALRLIIGGLNDKEHFYNLMRDLARNQGVHIDSWDKDWSKENLFGFSKQAKNAPERVLLALRTMKPISSTRLYRQYGNKC